MRQWKNPGSSMIPPSRPGVLFAASMLLAVPPLVRASGPVIHAVSCGSTTPLVVEGVVYAPDQEYDGLNSFGAIGGIPYAPLPERVAYLLVDRPMQDLSIYAQHRIGPDSYVFEVPNGDYELTIHLAGFRRDGPRTGVMDIVVEGDTLWNDFDLNAEVGKARACELRALVTVADSLLEVDFHDRRGDHDIAAFTVRGAGDDGPPAAPTGVEAVDTYGGVLVRWDRNLETDLAGYDVLMETAAGWRHVAERLIPMAVVRTDTTTRYAVVARDVYGNASDTTVTAPVGPRNPLASPLPRYDIYIDPDSLLYLDEDVQADRKVLGTFVADGLPRFGVELSYRGKSTRDAPKKSWNIDLGPGHIPLHGADRLILKSTFLDHTIQREMLMADVLGMGGIEHSITFPVRLYTNDVYTGVMLDIERLNDDFLARIGKPNATLYRSYSNLAPLADLNEYIQRFEVTAGVDHWNRLDVIALSEGLARTPDKDILPWLESHVDVDEVISLYCHYMWSSSEDWLGDDHFLMWDPSDSLWRMIPWDLSETWALRDVDNPIDFGTSAHPNTGGNYNRLVDRILSVPSLHRKYTEMLRSYTAAHLSAASITDTFLSRYAVITEDADVDVEKRARERADLYQAGVDEVLEFIATREGKVLSQLDAFELPEHVFIRLSELDPTPTGDGVQSVELYNLADRPFHLTNFYLSDVDSIPLKWAIGDTTIAPRGYLVYTPPATIAGGSRIGLWRDLGAAAFVDSVTVPVALSPNRGFGRYPASSGRWRLLDDRSPGAANRWTNPIGLTLSMGDQLVQPGAPVLLGVDAQNQGTVPMTGQVQLFVTTLEGIHLYDGPVLRLSLPLPAQWSVSRQGNQTVPPSFAPGGYRLEARYVINGDDALASDAREFFVLGDGPGTIVINEIMASNSATIPDEWGQFDDWVEIYNDTDSAVLLDGLYLTDDAKDDPFQWALPAETLGPRSHLLIWCDAEPWQGPHHANFRVSSAGEEVAIVKRNPGDVPVLLDQRVFGPIPTDTTIGRFPDGLASFVSLDTPTPNGANVYTPK